MSRKEKVMVTRTEMKGEMFGMLWLNPYKEFFKMFINQINSNSSTVKKNDIDIN